MTTFRFKLKGGYVIGLLTLPTEVGAVQVATLAGSKADALMRAATIAQRISEDPVMAALLPPQAAAAISAAKALSAAARQGPKSLKRLWGKIRGPGKKRLAEALAREAAETSGVGAMYFGHRTSVKQPNRGAWQEWLDYEHEDINPDDDPYDDEDYELGRRKRRKRKGRKRQRARERDDAPLDEPAAPVDTAPQGGGGGDGYYEDEPEDEPADNGVEP